ncbi:MAG: LamG-like jellyroll fold domain-containing protein [Planctomycetaceae bacterium]
MVVVYGEADNAVDFNGQQVTEFNNDVYAFVPHTDDLTPDRQLTISTWIYVDQMPTVWAPIVTKLDNGSFGTRTYALWLGGAGYIHFTSAAQGHGQDIVESSARSIVAGRWYHIAGVIDRTTGRQTLYINGVQAAAANVNRDNIFASSGPLVIGGTNEPQNVYNFFRGSIANVRLRDKALNAAEVLADMITMPSMSSDNSLVMELPLTNVRGSTTRDAINSTRIATFRTSTDARYIHNTDVVTSAILRVDRSYPGTLFAPTPSVELDADALSGLEEFTIELQYRTPEVNSGVQTLLHSGNAGSDNEFSVFLHEDGQIEVVDRGASSFWDSPRSSTDNEWHHLTLIRRAADVSLFAAGAVRLTRITDVTSAVSLDTTRVIRGKTIRVERSTGNEFLSLAEVIVKDFSGTNVARQGVATQSTTLTANYGGGRIASAAIDGNTNGSWNQNSVTHTNFGDSSPWWQVVLPEEIDIASIDLFNRTDAAMERLGNIRIVVLDADGVVTWQREIGAYNGATLTAYSNTNNINAATELTVSGLTGVVRNLEVIGSNLNVNGGYIVTPNGQRLLVEKVPGTTNRLQLKNAIPANINPNGDWLLFLTTDTNAHVVKMPTWTLRLETIDAGVTENSLRTISASRTVSGLVDDNNRPLSISGLKVNLAIDDYEGSRNFSAVLTSPQGTSVTIGDRTSVFLTDFNGENPNGDWTLTVDTGTDRSAFKVSLSAWELDVFTSGSEVILDGVSLGTRMTPSDYVLDPNAADRNFAINATGRYIRIEAAAAGQILKLADVSVLDARNRHIAVIGTASQSGSNSAIARLAIDTGAAYADTFAIAEAAGGKAYWTLDLGRDFDLSDVRLTLVDAGLNERVIVTVTRENGTIDFRNILDVHPAGLQGQYYYIGGSETVVDFPNLAGRTPSVRQQEPTINFGSTSSNFAGTGLNTQYASRWSGQINITTAGTVRFWLNSDDGSRLFIDGQQVILNGGTHGMREVSGTINLTTGLHDVVIDHFNGGGPGGMIFSYQLPGASKMVVPSSVLSTPVSSIFGNDSLATRTISMTTSGVAGTLTNIEVRTNNAGRGMNALLVGPGGELIPMALVSGETNRFVATSRPAIPNLNGTWTFVMTADKDTTAIDLTEADLILTNLTSAGDARISHAFGREGVSRSADGSQYVAALQTAVDQGPNAVALQKGLNTSVDHRSELNASGRYIRFENSLSLPEISISNLRIFDLQGRDITAQATATNSIASVGRVLLIDLGREYDLSDIQVALTAAQNVAGQRIHMTVTTEDGTINFRSSLTTGNAGLKGAFYSGRSNFTDVTNLTPSVVRYTGNLNFASTSGAFAGSGLSDQFYTEWTGRVRIDSPGNVTFFLNSDDGSRLYVDGRLVIENGGLHAMLEVSGQVNLTAGYHDIRVEYFENTGNAGAILSYQQPGTSKTVIPASALTSPLISAFGESAAPIRSLTASLSGLSGAPNTIVISGNVPDSSDFSFYLMAPTGQKIDLRSEGGQLVADRNTGVAGTTPSNGQWTLVIEPTSANAASPDVSSLRIQMTDFVGNTDDASLAPAIDQRHLSVAPLIVDQHGAVLGQDKDSVYGSFSPYQSFIGQMDNVRIWDHAVTPETAATLTNRPFSMIEDRTGLVAAWDFNQAMGNVVTDASGNNHTAMIQGVERRVRSVVTPIADNRPQSLQLDNDAVTLDYSMLVGWKEFTIETRIRSAPVAVGSIATFFSVAGSRTDNEFTLFLAGGGFFRLNDGGPAYEWTLSQPIDDNQWHDVSVVRHLVDGDLVVDLFVDGRFEGRRKVNNTNIAVSRNGIVLGQDQDSVGGGFDASQSFHGELDNLRIWTSVRTPEQIVSGLGGEIDSPQTQRDLAGYFRFNGTDTDLLKDSSMFGRDGINGSGSRAATGVLNFGTTAVRANTSETIDRVASQTLTLPTGSIARTAPMFGDFNGDGLTDIVIQTSAGGSSDSSVLMVSNFTSLGRTVSLSTGDHGNAREVVHLPAAASASLQITASLDINSDGADDLLFTSLDVGATGRPRTQLPIVMGAPDQIAVPLNFDVLANRSVTGSGDFVVDKGEVLDFDFEFTQDDLQSGGSSQRWIRFTTLGDGYASTSSDPTEGTWVQLSPHVRADLVDSDGNILARNFWFLNLSRFGAGTYFLKITSFAADAQPAFSIKMRAPLVGSSWQPSDRDQIYAGEGDDWITGGAFKDIIFGNGADHAFDTVVGEPIELRDVDVRILPARTLTISGQQVQVPEEVIVLDTLILPAASEVSTIPVTSTNPVRQISDLTETEIATLGSSQGGGALSFPVTLHAAGHAVPSGSVRQSVIENAQTNARTITGRVFSDLNGDGLMSAGETALDGTRVILRSADGTWLAETLTASIDLNGDGVINPETESGWYTFAGLLPGRYQVSKPAEGQFVPENILGGSLSTAVQIDGIHGQSVDFAMRQLLPGKISGTLFHDVNNNGVRESGEGILSGWTVTLFDRQGHLIASTTTNEDGGYEFRNVMPGNYLVTREQRSDWGPSAGPLDVARDLLINRLGLFFDQADFASWDGLTPLVVPSRTGLWYAYMPNATLLQGTTPANAVTGTLVRNFANALDQTLTLPQNLNRLQQTIAASARNLSVTESADVELDLWAREMLPGSISGQMINDANGNGVLDDSETSGAPGTVQLLNHSGQVVATTTADSAGRYQFTGLSVDFYFVQLVPNSGWRQTAPPIDPVAVRAWELDQRLDLFHTGQFFLNWGGHSEKWVKNQTDWFYILPDGSVSRWNGSSREDLSGHYEATLSPMYYQNPELLFAATPPGTIPVFVAEAVDTQVRRSLLTQVPATSITGSVFLDSNRDGQRSNSEAALVDGQVDLLDIDGNVVATTVAQAIDLNQDGSIDPATEQGIYRFENVEAGTYFVRVNPTSGGRQTTPPEDSLIAVAADLSATWRLRAPQTTPPTNLGRNEKWLEGKDGLFSSRWYYILPNGDVYHKKLFSSFFSSPGTKIGTLSPAYYNDPRLIYRSHPADSVLLRIDDPSSPIAGPHFGLAPIDDNDIDTLMSLWHTVGGDGSFCSWFGHPGSGISD